MFANLLLPALMLLTPSAAQVNTKSYVTCFTTLGARSTSPVKTVSNVLTLLLYAFKVLTSTPSTTITPAVSTSIMTDTQISTSTLVLPTETETATATSLFIYQFFVDGVPTTTTETSLTTSVIFTTDTTTIATPSGFVPIETSIPGSMKRRADAGSDSPDQLQERAIPLKIQFGASKPVFTPERYPQSVKCIGLVTLISTIARTRTGTSTLTIEALTPIVTSTQTTTCTLTVTLQPLASTTITVSLSETSTATALPSIKTSTTTITQTATVAAPQATYYAASAPNNIASTFNGQQITNEVYPGAGAQYPLTRVSSAYDCCAACFGLADCGATYFDGIGKCLLFHFQNRCPRSAAVLLLNAGTNAGGASSNGPCGTVQLS